jgi:hypothetical protein
MKTLQKILIAVLVIPVLMIMTGCPPADDPTPPPTNNQPSGIVVTLDDEAKSPIPAPFVIIVGEAVRLAVSATNADSYEWAVGNPATLGIDSPEANEDGIFKGDAATFRGLATGTTNIIVTARNANGAVIDKRIPITVNAAPSVPLPMTLVINDGQNVITDALSMASGTSRTLTPVVTSNGTAVTGAIISWSSATTTVATVNPAGVITAVNAGTSVITVTANRAGYIAARTTFTVTVSPPGTASITVGVFDDFAGLPYPHPLTVSKTGTLEITLTGAGITKAEWYIEGEERGTGNPWTINPDTLELDPGYYSLTVVVTVDSDIYSKKVTLKVE